MDAYRVEKQLCNAGSCRISANLVEAVQLALESNRQLSEEEISDKDIIKEPFGIVSTY